MITEDVSIRLCQGDIKSTETLAVFDICNIKIHFTTDFESAYNKNLEVNTLVYFCYKTLTVSSASAI